MSGAWVRLGVKCVCIDAPDRIARDVPPGIAPIVGQIYTVDWVWFGADAGYIAFAEFHSDVCCHHRLFRPLVSQARDIALFAHHLDRVGEPV